MPESNEPAPIHTGTPYDDLYLIQVRNIAEYAMFLIDTEGILVSWNAGVERLFGFTEQEWIGQHAGLIFTPPEQAMAVCQSEMCKAIELGSATDIRWHVRKDGTEFFANGFMNAIRDSSGRLLGFAKILSDETDRKRLQDSLTESNAALEQFAYVASHDLQEPLRTISAFSTLLKSRYTSKLDPEADQFLGFLTSAAARMSVLVSDLLSYARLTTEVERPVSVYLDEDLETAVSLLSQAIEESGALVTHDAMPLVRVDRGQIVRLFQNLIGNGIKYRRRAVRPKVHVAATRQDREWVISVSDNGIGFDPQYAANIFAPFKRLHTAEEYPGSGVGLAICKRIVQAQGGRIWAQSEPGVGSTFYFTLPIEGKQPLRHTPPIEI